MKRTIIHTSAAIALLLGIAACTQDEAGFLQEGAEGTPIVFTATGLNPAATAIANTRSTVDGDWEGVQSVAVLMDGTVKAYDVTLTTADPASATLTSTDPHYWTNRKDITVTAWWPYTAGETTPSAVKVKANQSARKDFEGSDLIVADGQTVTYGSTSFDNSYKGTFDGGGHTITGLAVTTNDQFVGLFGYLNRAGTVKNVVMEGIQITSNHGSSQAGGVVGFSRGTIENCSVSGSVSGTVYVGGVVGAQWGGSITGCSSSATVKGTVDVGGVAGQTNSNATMTACYATGNVTLEIAPINNIDVGGAVGFNGGSRILACYATGNVTSTGSSTVNVYIGGFCGYNSTTVTACYWKNNKEQGIGYNKVGTDTEVTKVDGTDVTWQKAVDAMNTALQNAGSEWRYELNGALPTLRKQ